MLSVDGDFDSFKKDFNPERGAGEERVLNAYGEPIGYQPLTGPRLLGNPDQELAFGRLPERFSFTEAKAVYGHTDDPTRKWREWRAGGGEIPGRPKRARKKKAEESAASGEDVG